MSTPLWRQQVNKLAKTDPDKYVDYLERCAILEYDGGMTRDAAEKRAWELFFGQQPKRPIDTPPR